MVTEKLESGYQGATAAADFPPDFSDDNRMKDCGVRPRAGVQRLCRWYKGITVSSDKDG